MSKLAQIGISIVLSMAFANLAHAAGGVYVDYVRVTTPMGVVFAEDFNKDSLQRWSYVRDGWIVDDEQNGISCLHLNSSAATKGIRFHEYLAIAVCPVNIDTSHIVDLRAELKIPPLSEQSLTASSHSPRFQLMLWGSQPTVSHMGAPDPETAGEAVSSQGGRIVFGAHRMDAEILISDIKPGMGRGYDYPVSVRDSWGNPRFDDPWPDYNKEAARPIPEALVDRWIALDLRLDPSRSIVTVFLDGVAMVKMSYVPADYPSITMIGLATSFGDGQPHKEAAITLTQR
jgi:hypothetical protein